MAPAIVNLINFDSDSVLIINLTEEENQNNYKVDLKEKQVVLYSYPDFDAFWFDKKPKASRYCIPTVIGFITEIPLPPPEYHA